MAASSVNFPRGKYYALTWSIPDAYGGMTNAMLHRSRAFHRLGGVPVEILTLDDRPDYAELGAALRESGELIEGLSIRNLWDDLRERTVNPATKPAKAVPMLQPEADDRVVDSGGVVLLRERRDTTGEFVAADRFRRDGTLLATERIARGRRSIVLYAPDGAPLRHWGSRWALYRWWLDRVFGGRLSFLLVDSKTSARFVPSYRREHVVTVHIVHGSHREDPASPELRSSRASTLLRATDFDLVTVLTTRQRRELLDDLARHGVDAEERVRVIPNAIVLPDVEPVEHARGEGIVVASIDERKRVDLAVEAVAEAHEQDESVELEIYGDGPLAPQLRAILCELGADRYVSMRGYRRDARSQFQRTDFSLLTSTNEGLPLVLVESMAAGCIPIAYDIRYGPADIIRDGVDGYVVPDGDTRALAERILELQHMSPANLQAMRRRAMQRAQAFSDLEITKRWARELQRALDTKRVRDAREQPITVRLRRRAGVVKRRLQRVSGR